MTTLSKRFALGWFVATIGVVAACGKTSATNEGQTGPQTQQTSSDRENNATTGDKRMNSARAVTAIDIFGFKLGAPYGDALTAAKGSYTLSENGAETHRGTGTLDGNQVSLNLQGKNGVLVDLQIKLTLAQADQGIDGSTLLTTLESTLGQTADKSSDVVRWRSRGFDVVLQREQVFSRGMDTPRVQYEVRARAVPVPAASGTDDSERADKQREADEAAP